MNMNIDVLRIEELFRKIMDFVDHGRLEKSSKYGSKLVIVCKDSVYRDIVAKELRAAGLNPITPLSRKREIKISHGKEVIAYILYKHNKLLITENTKNIFDKWLIKLRELKLLTS